MSNQSNSPSGKQTFDSAELYLLCLNNDPVKQEKAYNILWDYLYRVALQIVWDQANAEDMAADCAQVALVRIHHRLVECREPKAFRSWARRIVSHIAIDILRKRRRLLPWDDGQTDKGEIMIQDVNLPEQMVFSQLGENELRSLLDSAPISKRSRRLVIGRYVDGLADEELARLESELSAQIVRPSHLQVTRSKNISKLRKWDYLLSYLRTD